MEFAGRTRLGGGRGWIWTLSLNRIADVVTSEMIPRFKKLPEVPGRVFIGTTWIDFHTLGERVVIGISAPMVNTAVGENG